MITHLKFCNKLSTLWIKSKTLKEEKKSYPHFSKGGEEAGFSNWMTPSNGTSSPVTKTVWSVAKGEGEEEEVEGESESRFPSALASVRWKGLVELILLVMKLGTGLENVGGFVTVMNLGRDNREQHFENMAPTQGAWIWLTSIINASQWHYTTLSSSTQYMIHSLRCKYRHQVHFWTVYWEVVVFVRKILKIK